MSIETSGSNTLEQWQGIAQRELSSAQTKFFIDGDYRDAIDGARFDSINPANLETIAAVSAANEKDVDVAVAAARKAFRSGAWSDKRNVHMSNQENRLRLSGPGRVLAANRWSSN